MNDEGCTAADDAVEEVREVRRQLWECFNNDPARYGAFLSELHEQLVRDGWTESGPTSQRRGEIRRLIRPCFSEWRSPAPQCAEPGCIVSRRRGRID